MSMIMLPWNYFHYLRSSWSCFGRVMCTIHNVHDHDTVKLFSLLKMKITKPNASYIIYYLSSVYVASWIIFKRLMYRHVTKNWLTWTNWHYYFSINFKFENNFETILCLNILRLYILQQKQYIHYWHILSIWMRVRT